MQNYLVSVQHMHMLVYYKAELQNQNLSNDYTVVLAELRLGCLHRIYNYKVWFYIATHLFYFSTE